MLDRVFESLEPSSRAEGKPGYLTAACSNEQDGQRRSSRAVAGVGGGRAAVGGVARRGKPERLRRAWALRCAAAAQPHAREVPPSPCPASPSRLCHPYRSYKTMSPVPGRLLIPFPPPLFFVAEGSRFRFLSSV